MLLHSGKDEIFMKIQIYDYSQEKCIINRIDS